MMLQTLPHQLIKDPRYDPYAALKERIAAQEEATGIAQDGHPDDEYDDSDENDSSEGYTESDSLDDSDDNDSDDLDNIDTNDKNKFFFI
eukprot:UN03749